MNKTFVFPIASRLRPTLMRVAAIALFAVPAISMSQKAPEKIMKTNSARYENHANGHLQYERSVYFSTGVPLEEIKSEHGIAKQYATRSSLRLWDTNDLYWDNEPGFERYRIDAVNKLPVANQVKWTTGSKEALEYVIKDYSRVYIKDTKINQHFLGFKIRSSNEFAHIQRTTANDIVSIDPPEIYDGGLSPVFIIFSQFAHWDLISKECDSFTNIRTLDAAQISFRLKCGSEIYNFVGDTTSQTLISYEYSQDSEDASPGAVPVLRVSYSQFAGRGSDIYPHKVTAQLYQQPTTDKSPLTSNTLMNVSTFVYKVNLIEFDKPEFSEKIKFNEMMGHNVSDDRFDQKHPISYTVTPDQTDADILAIQKQRDRARLVKKYSKAGTYGVIILAIVIATGVWVYRNRR